MYNERLKYMGDADNVNYLMSGTVATFRHV